jgi:hypothetical protein
MLYSKQHTMGTVHKTQPDGDAEQGWNTQLICRIASGLHRGPAGVRFCVKAFTPLWLGVHLYQPHIIRVRLSNYCCPLPPTASIESILYAYAVCSCPLCARASPVKHTPLNTFDMCV